MPEGGSLTVRSRRAAPEDVRDLSNELGYVELSVQDDGIGMDEATRSRLFEPFFTTKGEGRGTGLGLATVHAIVADSHGKVSVESELGQGACFRVFLPLADGPGVSSAKPPAVLTLARGKRVLLVDDEPPVRFVAAHILREEGYEVLEAADGERALELARNCGGAIDLLCTDGILPGLRTDVLIAQFRALFPGAQVLVCSGHVQEELLRRSIADGSCAFVPKPFTPDDLLRAVAMLTQTQPPPAPRA
jgi:two-component system cell cycle sensor histidine kinase/response regulator CckA